MTTLDRIHERLTQLNTEAEDTSDREDATVVSRIAVYDAMTGKGLAVLAKWNGESRKMPFTVTGQVVTFRGMTLAL